MGYLNKWMKNKFPFAGYPNHDAMSDDIYPLSLVVRKDLSPSSKLEPKFEPRKRFKALTERVNLEGRAEEILVEIEPNLQEEEEISIGDELQKSEQVCSS